MFGTRLPPTVGVPKVPITIGVSPGQFPQPVPTYFPVFPATESLDTPISIPSFPVTDSGIVPVVGEDNHAKSFGGLNEAGSECCHKRKGI